MNRWSRRGGRASMALALLVLLVLSVGSAQARQLERSATVKVTMSSGPASKPALDVLIPSFEQEYPDIEVSVTYPPTSAVASQLTLTQLAAGNAPDILPASPGCGTPTSVCRLAPAGHLANMPNKPWAKRSSSVSISASKYGAGLYVYSPTLTFEGLWTNDSMFKKLGLKVPETFRQLLSVCRQAKAAGTIPVILPASGSQVVQQLAATIALTTVYAKDPKWGQKLRAGTATFSGSTGWRAALQEILDLKNAGCLQPGPAGTTSPAAAALFGRGEALMYVNMTSKKGEIDAARPAFAYSQHPFPTASRAADNVVMVFLGSSWGVNAHASATNQAAAQKFIDFLARPKRSAFYARINGGLSHEQFRKGLIPGYLSSYAPLFKAGKYAINPAQTWQNAAVGEALTTYGTGLLTGQTSVDDVLKAMDAGWKLGPD